MHEIIYVGDNNDNEAQPNFYTCFMSKQKRLTEEKKGIDAIKKHEESNAMKVLTIYYLIL